MENNGGSTPKQYSIPEGTKDLQDLIEYRNMNFAQGNIFKAIYRDKGNYSYDLHKIIWFANRELQRMKNETQKSG